MFTEIYRILVTGYTNSKSPGSNCIPVNVTKDTSKHLSQQAPVSGCCRNSLKVLA